MKHKALLLATMITGLQLANMAHAADGTIQFTGNIIDTACTVTTESQNQTVNLGNVATTAFPSAGATAAPSRFSIVLTDCPSSVASASVRFDGTGDANNSQILALNNGQTAKNVGVAIYEQNSTTLIPLASDSQQVTLTPEIANELTYIAKYYATAYPVEAGTANATTAFTITYN